MSCICHSRHPLAEIIIQLDSYLFMLFCFIERAKSPPLTHQDELDVSSSEASIEDDTILEDFTATGNYRPGM